MQLNISTIDGPSKGKEENFTSFPISIGRRMKSDYTLSDPYISRQHAIIYLNDNNYPTISDLESTNGTYVQDRKIKNPTILNDSDLISIGKTVLLFKIKPDN